MTDAWRAAARHAIRLRWGEAPDSTEAYEKALDELYGPKTSGPILAPTSSNPAGHDAGAGTRARPRRHRGHFVPAGRER